jgi:hypothetical protein
MKHATSTLRPGMTAIAAALALTTTPLFAQGIDPVAPVPSEPTLVTPPAPVTPPVAATPAAPEAALNIPKITVNMDDAPATAEPAAKPAETAAAPAAPVQRAAPERVERTASAPAPAPAAAEPAAAPVTTARAVEGTALESPPTPPVAVVPTAPAEVTPVPVTREATADITDEIVLGAGGILGALALAGGAFAFSSRRRRHRNEEMATAEASAQPLTLDTPVAAPAMTPRYAAPTPVAATAGTALPAGFDLSRFGRHVQAAYHGPTQDNPSLSLSKRLKRARFYDQRERAAVTRPAPAATQQPQAPAAQPVRQPEFVTSRRIGGGNAGFRPAYQG